ncbi:hypothetical protein NDU88_003749 [Pleurodeles waltl]|uniref:Uncharacterized protein n=1 Tax=Pleurodeles waltl TaxID=8319 RepID=A0AAV7RH38_PLEWA|nr:hypothetical protein NDU88_003749 [Pleurodeles waltl]
MRRSLRPCESLSFSPGLVAPDLEHILLIRRESCFSFGPFWCGCTWVEVSVLLVLIVRGLDSSAGTHHLSPLDRFVSWPARSQGHLSSCAGGPRPPKRHILEHQIWVRSEVRNTAQLSRHAGGSPPAAHPGFRAPQAPAQAARGAPHPAQQSSFPVPRVRSRQPRQNRPLLTSGSFVPAAQDTNATHTGARPPLLLRVELSSSRAPRPWVSTLGAALLAATQLCLHDMPGGPLVARSSLRTFQVPIQVTGEQRAPPLTPS